MRQWRPPWPQTWGQVFGTLALLLVGFPLKGAIGSGRGVLAGLAEAGAGKVAVRTLARCLLDFPRYSTEGE